MSIDAPTPSVIPRSPAEFPELGVRNRHYVFTVPHLIPPLFRLGFVGFTYLVHQWIGDTVYVFLNTHEREYEERNLP